MAFDRAEIAALRQKIPAEFQPGNAPEIRQAFDYSKSQGDPYTAMHGSENTRELAGLALQGTDAEGGAFMLTGAQAARRAHDEQGEQQKRDHERLIHDQIIDALNRRLDDIRAEIATIDERLEQIRDRRAEIGVSLDAVDDIEELLKTGKLDPSDPRHAELMRRAGVTPEDMRGKDAADILRKRKAALYGEDSNLNREQDDLFKRKDKLTREEDEIKSTLADLENANTDEAKAKIYERAQTTLGKQQLAEALYQPASLQMQNIAITDLTRDTDSRSFALEAVSQTDAFLEQSDEITWADDPPTTNPAIAPAFKP